MEIEKGIVKIRDGSYIELYHKKGDKDYWHREDGPAWIRYNKDGSIESESYWINNKRHREDGPAYIGYNQDGSIRYKRYYINDEELTEEQWEREYGWKLKLKGTPMEKIYCK